MTINYEIAIIGDSETGKTTFCRRNARLQFLEQYIPTVGAVQYFETIPRQQEMPSFRFDINDVSGREKDRMILPTHVKPAKTVLLFFDVNKPDTFENLKTQYLQDPLLFPEEKKTQQLILVGNQQEHSSQQVSLEEIEQLKAKYNMDYFQINAKQGDGIKDLKSNIIAHAIKTVQDIPECRTQINLENQRLAMANKKYDDMWDPADPIQSIKNILEDYARGTNLLRLFWGCHLNRHHTKEVDAIVKEIHQDSDFRKILDKLNGINKSSKGTLVLITTYLCNKLDYISDRIVEQEPGSTTFCGLF